jgi:anti-sigma regulatory factor (Ser/Thr protein kinase)
MGQLRSALRAFALSGEGPAAVLTRLSAFANTVDGALAATAVYAIVDPAAGELRYACAGHPWPLLAGSDGATRYLVEGRSLPLACAPDPVYEEATEPLRPGDTLLLFTDGLTERRGVDPDESFEGLRGALAERSGMPLSTLLDSVVAAQGADAPMDDVALLAVRLAGAETRARRLRMPAQPEHVAAARSEVRSWLAEAEIDPGTASDVLLACGEAMANAVEHAYRGREPEGFEIVMRISAAALELEVRDEGGWKDDGGSPDRGRGFALMRALMHAVEVERTAGGTLVRMLRRLDAPPAAPPASEPREPAPATVRIEAGVAHVSGDLDFVSAPGVRARLGDAATLDLSDVGYLDSAGARLLLELGLPVVAAPGSVARRTLELMELDAPLGLRP